MRVPHVAGSFWQEAHQQRVHTASAHAREMLAVRKRLLAVEHERDELLREKDAWRVRVQTGYTDSREDPPQPHIPYTLPSSQQGGEHLLRSHSEQLAAESQQLQHMREVLRQQEQRLSEQGQHVLALQTELTRCHLHAPTNSLAEESVKEARVERELQVASFAEALTEAAQMIQPSMSGDADTNCAGARRCTSRCRVRSSG